MARLGRNPSPAFDANEYLRSNPDVARSGCNPLLHYLRYGKAEGRTATRIGQHAGRDADRQLVEELLFDADFYRAEYPHVVLSDLEPIDEFMAGGWRGGDGAPSPRFETGWYRN